MRRFIVLLMLLIPALACNLGGSTAPTPTAAPQPVLTTPTLGLNPVVGAPGTVVNVSAAGFPVGTRVNLFLSPVSTPSTSPITTLTIGAGGILTFALQLPGQIGNTPVGNNTPLVFTMTAETGGTGASALFLALGSGASTATPDITGGTTGGGATNGGTTGGTGQTLFITGPAIGSYLAGNTVVVTGSGAATNNTVGVQVQDANNTVLGSANATIQASAGYIGPWQVTVTFNQPAGQTSGYIVAFTAAGQQASIPVTLAGSGGQAPATLIQPQNPATAVPIQPTIQGGVQPIMTATKLFQ